MAESKIYLNGVPTDPIAIYNNIVAHKYTKDQELILGTNLMENGISFFDLSWSIAKSAYDTYGKGKVSDYYNKETFKMANIILGTKKANKVKIGMKVISESIVNQICEDYYNMGKTIASGQNSSGKHYNTVSLGIQRARLEKALRHININGENSLNTGFWQWADIHVSQIVDNDAFYDSDGSEDVTGSLVIHSVNEIVNEVESLIPMYDQILNNMKNPQYASANMAAIRSANIAYDKQNQQFDKALKVKRSAAKMAERAAKKAKRLKEKAKWEAEKQKRAAERAKNRKLRLEKQKEAEKKRKAKASKAKTNKTKASKAKTNKPKADKKNK